MGENNSNSNSNKNNNLSSLDTVPVSYSAHSDRGHINIPYFEKQLKPESRASKTERTKFLMERKSMLFTQEQLCDEIKAAVQWARMMLDTGDHSVLAHYSLSTSPLLAQY